MGGSPIMKFKFHHKHNLNKINNYFLNSTCFKAILKILTIIMLIVLIVPNGCKNSFSKLFGYSVQCIPKNLDPQTASTSDEISIICNVFEGLYKQNPNKTYSLAAASNVQSNEAKTKFLFNIKTDRFWSLQSTDSDEKQKFCQPLNASDFEFAFKRLLNPNTNSPFAQNFYFIKNAQPIHEGKMRLDNLGVKAQNNQLLMELEHPVPNLEELLSSAPAMPCNELFFQHTKGRYGLSLNTLMCNGLFYIHFWPQNRKDKKLRLRVNKKHPDSSSLKIIGVNLSQRSQKEALKLLSKNEIDSSFLDLDQTDLQNNKISSTNKIINFQNSTSGIFFNQNSALFKNEKIRQALAMTIDREHLNSVLNRQKSTIAKNLIPGSVSIAGENFQNLRTSSSTCLEFNVAKAKELFADGIAELKPKIKSKNKKSSQNNVTNNSLNLNQFSILVNENQYYIANEILQNWQQNLNLYLKVDLCDNETYLKKLQNKNFDCTLTTLENEFNNPIHILSKFLPNSSSDFNNNQLTNLQTYLNAAAQSASLHEMAKNFEQAEKEILNSANFIPIHHPIKIFAHTKKFDGIFLDPSCKLLIFSSINPIS